METQTLIAAIFEAFSTEEIMTEDWTYKVMTDVYNELCIKCNGEGVDLDNLSELQYTALQAGFYAGYNMLRSMVTGQNSYFTAPI